MHVGTNSNDYFPSLFCQKFYAIQDALLRRLHDDDLNVVLAVLNLKNVAAILSSPLLTEALQNVLQRCIQILLSSKHTVNVVPLFLLSVLQLNWVGKVIKSFTSLAVLNQYYHLTKCWSL